jgi:hypothetical protein
MLENVYRPDENSIANVIWTGDHYEYDQELYQLGKAHPFSLVYNPRIKDKNLVFFAEDLSETDKCVVFVYQGDWVAKLFPQGWEPHWNAYLEVLIEKPQLAWTKNPELDKLMEFEEDIINTFEIEPWDTEYKLVWYIDPKYNPTDEKVWAISCQAVGKATKGIKEMGYVTPDVEIEFNEYLPDLGVNLDECYPAYWELIEECAWELDPNHQTEGQRLWVVKFCPRYRRPKTWKWMGIITPVFDVVYNPELPVMNYDIDYAIPWHDFTFEHIWLIDRKHLRDGEEEMWAFKITVSTDIEGSKFIDYISPVFDVVHNPELPVMNYDLDYNMMWHDFTFEHVWLIDRKHRRDGEEEMWAFKITVSTDIEGSKFIGYISPDLQIELNPALPELEYKLDYNIMWHDFKFEHIWMLDRKHIHNDEDDIWAVRVTAATSPEGSKFIDYTAPVEYIEYNPDLEGMKFDLGDVPYYHLQYNNIWMLDTIWAVKKRFVGNPQGDKYLEDIEPEYRFEFNDSIKNLYVEIDYEIPVYDRAYEHTWYTDINNEKVWVAKFAISNKLSGTKEMGTVVPMLPPQLDVVFISYDEPNAEENWQRLLEKAPYAKRVNGVEGILNAHKAAAELATTDMFYVVDADAWVTDEWTFDFQPGLYDRDCVYVWQSANPFNDIKYGFGGVKLFPTSKLKNTVSWGTDLTLSVGKKLKVIDQVSNVTRFNTSEYNTWRSSFRECAKLAKKTDTESAERLQQWLNPNDQEPFAHWARLGAEQGVAFALDNSAVNKINNYSWLKEYFRKINGR